MGVAAYDRSLDLRAVDDAMAIGQARDDVVRLRFHQPYRIPVGRLPIDYIDVVTPFRRVELAAEERARVGDRMFRQREALTVLAEHGDTLQLFVEAAFHPQNVYVRVPAYAVTLARPDQPARIRPRDEQRLPRFGPRVDSVLPLPYPVAPSLPAGGQPLTGGTVIATFDGQRLDPGATYEVVIEEAERELARARLDLGKLR
ncbi:MAG: hypothetical protein ACRD3C_22055 [Vicinamibacterales bacterium]